MQPIYSHGNSRLANSFFSLVQDNINRVEALILSQSDGHDPDLGAAIKLLLSSGGKRIRPTVTLLVGQMLGAPTEKLVTVAAAIEMLHTATLVHDDLIDGSLLRRGTPTLNSQWTPGATVLTGDFIFARAAKLAADAESVRVMKVFSQTLTIIVNGEITQLFSSRCVADRDSYNRRIYAKTASLFETSASTPAMVSQAGEETIEAMRQFGLGIGMAFQIIDDVLDFTGEQATVGKPVGSDLRQGIITLPTLHYIEMFPDVPEVKEMQAGNCLDDVQARRLVDAIRTSPAIRRSLDDACEYVQNGIKFLQGLPGCEEKDALKELAEYVISRTL
jgi:geranylgeranyl pyrophosphate synthase